MIRRPPRSTLDRSSAASDVYKRQALNTLEKEDIQLALLNLNARNNIYKTDTKSAEKYLSEVNNLVGLDNVKNVFNKVLASVMVNNCLLYTSPSPRDRTRSRMPSSA